MTVRTTRRAAFAGVLAGAAAPSVARGAAPRPNVIIKAKAIDVRRGRALAVGADARYAVIAHDARTTVEIRDRTTGRVTMADVGGHPLKVAISPDGQTAAVTMASWKNPGLVLIDLARAAVGARMDVGPAPSSVKFTPDGRRLLVAGGEQDGTLHVVDLTRRGLPARHAVGAAPRGLAATDEHAWLALNAGAKLVRLDLATGAITQTLPAPSFPDEIALAPDGARLLVTHGGRDSGRVSEIEAKSGAVRRHLAGRLPSAVGWGARGNRLVAIGGAAAVLDLDTGRSTPVGLAPRGLATAGGQAFTVSAVTGELSEVRA